MASKRIVATFMLLAASAAMGQSDFTLTGIVPEAGEKTALDVNYTGAFPSDASAYLSKDVWRVWVKRPGDAKPEELDVTAVERIVSSRFTVNKLRLTLSGSLPSGMDLMTPA